MNSGRNGSERIRSIFPIRQMDDFKVYVSAQNGQHDAQNSKAIFVSYRSMRRYLEKLFSGDLPAGLELEHITTLNVFAELPFGHPKTEKLVCDLRTSLSKSDITIDVRDVNAQPTKLKAEARFVLTLGQPPNKFLEEQERFLLTAIPGRSLRRSLPSREDRIEEIKNCGVWN